MANLGSIGINPGARIYPNPDFSPTSGRMTIRGVHLVSSAPMASGTMDSSVGNLAQPSLRMDTKGIFTFPWAVDARQRTISVYVKQEVNVSPRPQMNILANSLIGVSAASSVASSSTGWVQLSLTFTPTATGVIEIQLEARYDCQLASDSVLTKCYWDDFAEVLI